MNSGFILPASTARIGAGGRARHLYAADLSDPGPLIHTPGESRLSGFALWQSAHAEFALVFADLRRPAFRRTQVLRAICDFSRRERRFGR